MHTFQTLKSPVSIPSWVIWLVPSIFYAYQYILRILPSVMMQEIVEKFAIDVVTFGQFSGVYYLGYALFHLPIGYALDRYGPRLVLPICMLLTAFGLTPLFLPFTNSWVLLLVGRTMIGIGSSAAILGTFKVIHLLFPEKLFTRMLSFSVTIGLVGAIYGGGPVSIMCAKWGSSVVVSSLAVLGLALALLSYLLIPAHVAAPQKSGSKSSILSLLTNYKVIAVCICSGLMVSPLEGFADVWSAKILQEYWHMSKTTADSLPSLIFIGMCVGGPLLSFVAERRGNYLAVIILAGLLMFSGIAIATKLLVFIPYILALFIAVTAGYFLSKPNGSRITAGSIGIASIIALAVYCCGYHSDSSGFTWLFWLTAGLIPLKFPYLFAPLFRNNSNNLSISGSVIAALCVMLISWKLGGFSATDTGEMQSYLTIALAFIVIGIGCAYQIIAIYQATTYVKEELVGITTAVTNMIIMLFGYFSHSAIAGAIANPYIWIQSSSLEQSPLSAGGAAILIALALGTIGFIILAAVDNKKSSHSTDSH